MHFLNSVNNQRINTFFLTEFDDNLTSKQRSSWRELHSNQSATAGSRLQATLVKKDVAKEDLEEDSLPNYSEIAYQLLKTFAGKRASSCKQHNKQLNLTFITDHGLPPDYWRVCCIAFMQSTCLPRKADGSMHTFYTGL